MDNQQLRILLTAAAAPIAIWLFVSLAKLIERLVKLLPEGRIRRLLLWRSEK